MEEDDNKLTTPLLHDDDEEVTSGTAEEENNNNINKDGLNIDTSEAPSSSSPTKSISPRFYDAQSQWPTSLTNKRRASYLDKLILNRQVATKNLLSELSLQDTNLDDTIAEEGDIVDDDDEKKSQENDSEFVNKLQDFLKTNVAGGAATLRDQIPSMEIRLVDLTYKVPSSNEKWGKNKIPTLYNMSPIYMMKKLVQRMTDKDNRRATAAQQGGDTLTTNVLTNVNLCLKPGKMVSCSVDVYCEAILYETILLFERVYRCRKDIRLFAHIIFSLISFFISFSILS